MQSIQQLLGKTIDCACERKHTIRTEHIAIGEGTLCCLAGMLRELGARSGALIVADENTWAAAGPAVEEQLRRACVPARRLVFPAGDLHTDEHAVGSVLMEICDETELLVAVGSGTINDLCRFVAKRTGLCYLVVGTAPSVDGYASDVTPVVRGGIKQTFKGVAPWAVIGDTAVLQTAPGNMVAAGFGDVFGKVTARLDWMLAHELLGEFRCDYIAQTMDEAVQTTLSAAPALSGGGARAVEELMHGLVLSGIAMQMLGDSRPASGAEHHVSHFLEMRDLARGRHGTLHGDKVGVATLMVMRMYEKFFEPEQPIFLTPMGSDAWRQGLLEAFGPLGEQVLSESNPAHLDAALRARIHHNITECWDMFRAEAAKLPALRLAGERDLRASGGPVRPAQLGYDRADVVDALNWAMEVRDKFTILRLAWHCGRLATLAEEVADEFCQ